MMKLLKKNPLYILLGILIIPILIYLLFKWVFKSDDRKSEDSSVDSVINIIDASIDKLGTFDSDHKPIFEVLPKLSKKQIIRLHEDFGYRYYNDLTRSYSFVQILEGYGVARKLDLSSIFFKEFSPSQISDVKSIYLSKGLFFPLVLRN
ncbi:conserved hypothetical protein [Tenacibaculum maritimum]|uniref:hypothetical protein n=1 Tax=Tenacibaculum maritimum TaxID=107401 RepID=UPI0012E5612E|nr:hypothetical protein [Tenacibaculum maritimum]CAA0215929.1 conserved hypothetical protein [Tenacibaculum maritimum]